jgi:hypothetical protein
MFMRCISIFSGVNIFMGVYNYYTSNLNHICNSLEQSPSWGVDGHSAGQEIPPPHLWKPKVHYRVDKSPPLGPAMIWLSRIHNLMSSVFKIYFNIFLRSMTVLPSVFFPSGFSTKICCVHFSYPTCLLHVPRASFIFICSPDNIWLQVTNVILKISFMIFS